MGSRIKPLARLSALLCLLLKALLVLEFLYIVELLWMRSYMAFGFADAGALAKHEETMDAPSRSELLDWAVPTLSTLLGSAFVFVYLASAIVFLMWIYRAHRNLRALSGVTMKYTAGWVVSSYFIPFVNLVTPPRAMNELWAVSRKSPNGSFVSFWWFLVIIKCLTSEIWYAGFRRSATSLEALMAASYSPLSLIDSVAGLLLTAVTFLLVSLIAAAYQRNFAAMPSHTDASAAVQPVG